MVVAYNSLRNEHLEVEAGFLIVKTFAALYRDWRDEGPSLPTYYAIPRADREPEHCPVQYRGLDRDALDDWEDSELDAEQHLALLALENRAVNGIVFSQQDAEKTFSLLGSPEADYEIVWARVAGSDVPPPDGYDSIGSEPTYLVGDHFSASCDCMLFPRWHGTDKEGGVFMPYFRQLNSYGLFTTAAVAQEFLDYYHSFDWTEHDSNGDYVIAEVFIEQ